MFRRRPKIPQLLCYEASSVKKPDKRLDSQEMTQMGDPDTLPQPARKHGQGLSECNGARTADLQRISLRRKKSVRYLAISGSQHFTRRQPRVPANSKSIKPTLVIRCALNDVAAITNSNG